MMEIQNETALARKIYFSPSQVGFFSDDVRDKATMPIDVVEIDEATYESLMDAPTKGYVIEADANGYPVAVDPTPVPFKTQSKLFLANVQTLREQILSRLAGIGFDAMADGNTELAEDARAARQRIKDLPDDPRVTAAITSQDIAALVIAMKAAYADAVAATPDTLKNAFNSITM